MRGQKVTSRCALLYFANGPGPGADTACRPALTPASTATIQPYLVPPSTLVRPLPSTMPKMPARVFRTVPHTGLMAGIIHSPAELAVAVLTQSGSRRHGTRHRSNRCRSDPALFSLFHLSSP